MSDLSKAGARPLPLPRTLLHPRHWPVWLGVGLLALLARLPFGLQRRLGAGLGWLLRQLAGSRRRTAERNLARCLPELDDAARQHLLRENFRDLGIGVFEFARAWWGGIASIRARTQIEGLEHIQRVLDQGRGVLLVSGHFSTLELCGRLLCDHVPIAGMYRRHDSPAMEWAVKRGRLRYACAMFTKDEIRATVRHLKAGGVLWYAPDQDMLGKDTVFAPFFGLPAATITATHQLARLSGCAVIPFAHRREGDRYLLQVQPALDDFPSSDAAADSARVNAAVEAMVRAAPSQYLWLHKRFKRRPPGEPPFYD
jgi:Kdo2-lipid IVA lauroyltransferase/acyltransferase